MSEKPLSREIQDLLTLERDRARGHGDGQYAREQDMIYQERKRDLFGQLHTRAVLDRDDEERAAAAAVIKDAEAELKRLDEQERRILRSD